MNANNPIKSVDTSIRLLELLKELDGATVTDLTDRLDLTKGSVHNHLSTLASHGIVVQDESDGSYRIGMRLFEFGEYVKDQCGLYDLAVPEVEMLADRTGELGNLLVEEHGQGIYLYRASGEQALSLDTGIGSRVNLHNTALGKSILAFTPRDRIEAILDRHGMERTTENTITSRAELFDELDEIRERGVAFDLEERAMGVQCVAAPVRTKDGRVLGAISVAGPVTRMKLTEDPDELVELVANTADVIGINATYR